MTLLKNVLLFLLLLCTKAEKYFEPYIAVHRLSFHYNNVIYEMCFFFVLAFKCYRSDYVDVHSQIHQRKKQKFHIKHCNMTQKQSRNFQIGILIFEILVLGKRRKNNVQID